VVGRFHRFALRAMIALLLVALTIPGEALRPDPASVGAAAIRPDERHEAAPPATPGTYRSTSSATSPPITTITVSKPAGVTTNDVLVAGITVRGTPTITPPAGWTLIRSDANGTTITQAMYQKVAGGSEAGSYAWTFNFPITSAVGGIVAYSGVDTTSPVDVSGGQANASSSTVTAPSVTTTVANTKLVGFFGTANDATFSAASGMTERYDVDADGTNQIGGEGADETKAAAGATGTRAATASVAAVNIGQLVALRPSGTITLRAAASAETVPTLGVTINTPASVVADDVLIAGVSLRGNDTITAPAGWTQVRTDTTGSDLRQSVFVRTVVSGEPGSHAFTFSGPVGASTGGIIAFDGLDPVDPVDVSGGQTNASSTSVVAPSITTTVADTTLVGLFAIVGDVTFTPPSGMTERFDVKVDSSNDSASSAADVSVAAVGATGTKTATASSGGVNIGALVALRPATATQNLGLQAQHTFESWDLGAGDSVAVNAATRNAVISHPLFSLPIRGSAISVSATYNAKDRTDVGMGPGWRLDVFRRLRLNGDDTVTFSDGSGARHEFTSPQVSGSTTTYTRPATIYASLVKDTTPNPDRFTLTYRDQSVDEFDVSGGEALLVRAEDRFGNGVDLAYSGTNLATITDTVPTPDRIIDFAWDTGSTPDHLTSVTDWAYVSGGVVQTTSTGSRRAHRFFYDGSGYLSGWADPVDTSGNCSSAASHRTCLTIAGGLVTAIAKTQTYTTESSGTLGTSTRAVTTEIAYTGADVSTVTDAEEQAQGSPERTTFTVESSTKIRVDRPTTTTSYGTVAAGDQYGRIQSMWRKLDGSTSLETRTTWDTTYPTEPASVTANYGALQSTPARTTSYTYVASSMGLVEKIVEPLTATDDRWTEFAYNTNNDVVLETVSLEGSATDKTVTKSCYTTQSNSCSDASPGLTLVRKIDRWVSGGASDEDTNVVTDYAYDAYGRLTSTTRANRDGSGTLLDSRVDAITHDDKGNVTSEITNYVDGVVTPGTIDTEPAAGGARTDLTTTHTYDTAGNRVSTADPRRAIGNAATTSAHDDYGRTVADGWGSADTGGSWSGTTADHDVASGIGTVALTSATNRNAYLTSVSLRDLDVLVKVRVDRLAVTNDLFTWLYLRRQDSNNYYQARLTFTTNAKTVVSLVETDAGTTTVLGAATTSLPHTTTDWYWLRASLTGTTTTVFKARVWKDGTTEPSAWTIERTDTTPPTALQSAGHIGIRLQASASYSGSFPIIGSYDGLHLTTPGGGGSLGTDDYVSRSTFDPLNQAITSSTPTTPGLTGTAETSTTTYDELGAVRRSTDISDLVTAMVFDRAGRALTTYEDPSPAGSAYVTGQTTYDADGNPLTVMDRRQAAAAPGFSLGWTAFGYDGLGRAEMVTYAEGSSPDVESTTTSSYDALDQVTATEIGTTASQRTEFTYDLGGREIEIDDGFTCATATYDYRDLVLATVDSLDTSTCAANADSRTITNSHDALGRLTQAEVTDGPDDGDKPTIATFDAIGNALTSAMLVGGTTDTTTFTRTKLDQVVTEARPDGSDAKWTYDAVGNVLDACTWAAGTTVGDCLAVGTAGWSNPPSRSTSTRWDARNGRIGLTDSASNRTTAYDPNNGYAVSAIYQPTDADQTKEHQSLYGYDARHRLTSITHQLCTISSGHSCSADPDTGTATYAYDDSDNRTHVVEHNGSASTDFYYCHDARNQLTGRGSTSACGTSSIETFTFDDAGNRTQAVEAGTTRNFAYTATGLLCDQETGSAASCTSGNVTSDDAGRISDQGGWHYLYDAKARLVSACDDADCVGSGFDRVDFEYDGEGHRTTITDTPASGSALVWTFRYQGDAIVAEYKDGTLYREYVTDDQGTISKVIVPAGQTGTGTYLVTWNGHGDAMALHRIESSGSLTLANSYTYGTWGQPTTATHNSIANLGFRFLYVGAADVQWDAAYGLDLLYMHARHYSPTLGRFLQPDPARAQEAFAYSGNSPVSQIDPSGLVAVSFERTSIGPCGGRFNSIRAVAWAGGGSDPVSCWGALHSTSILYTGPSAAGTIRSLRVRLTPGVLEWHGSETVGSGWAYHGAYAYMALVDHTAGVRRRQWTLEASSQECAGGLKWIVICTPGDWADNSNGETYARTYSSSSGIIRNHRYRIDYWIVSIAAAKYAVSNTTVTTRNITGSISW
jgi:RHS repeat-associated protein